MRDSFARNESENMPIAADYLRWRRIEMLIRRDHLKNNVADRNRRPHVPTSKARVRTKKCRLHFKNDDIPGRVHVCVERRPGSVEPFCFQRGVDPVKRLSLLPTRKRTPVGNKATNETAADQRDLREHNIAYFRAAAFFPGRRRMRKFVSRRHFSRTKPVVRRRNGACPFGFIPGTGRETRVETTINTRLRSARKPTAADRREHGNEPRNRTAATWSKTDNLFEPECLRRHILTNTSAATAVGIRVHI